MTTTARASGLDLVTASAGSGKTYHLTQEVSRRLDPSHPDAVEVEGLVAVTYTTKAQAELESRLGRALVQKGAFARAEQLPLAYLGTVHAVCLRLLQEFAIEAGVSPAVDGVPQEAARRLLQEALEDGLAGDLRTRLDELSNALDLQRDTRTDRIDWITSVDDITTLARNNRLRPEALPAMGERSARGFLEMLGPGTSDGAALERALDAAMGDAVTAIEQLGDRTKTTASALTDLRDARRDLSRGRLGWRRWNKLANLTASKKALPLLDEVRTLGARYLEHPEFRRQVVDLCTLLFEAARVGLDAYARWKAERGLVDYVDMIDRALSVLSLPEVEDELRERVGLLAVDEFQDTSPVQLELFIRLHELCGRSTWVGDRKQCIFEYAGADPTLMEAVARWAAAQGGQAEILDKNYRSRPELVHATSELFARAFGEQGYRPEEVATSPERPAIEGLAGLPPLGVWRCHKSYYAALAAGVGRLLAEPEQTPVLDRRSGQVRPVRSGDIAILVATNAHAEKVAEALTQRGIASVLPVTGLMRTPEGTLLVAALRLLVNRRDTLAEAEIEALLGFDGRAPSEWLDRKIAEANRAERDAPSASFVRKSMERVRPLVAHASPAEMVDHLLAAFDFPTLASRWPVPEQRMGNLDALRALALAYEQRCTYLREAASLPGLIRYFEETQIKVRERDEERASDEQHVASGGDAVVISTYHKAKGLEWPVVVLADLDRPRSRDAFEVVPETEREGFDPSDPLGGRWIRCWPRTLPRRTRGPIVDRAAQSREGRAVSERDGRERVRLLYVGFTRARDHLIFGVPLSAKKQTKADWLDELRDGDGALVELPSEESADAAVGIRGQSGELSVPARVWSLSGEAEVPEHAAAVGDRLWLARSERDETRALYWIQPSSVEDGVVDGSQVRTLETVRFSRRVAFKISSSTSWDEVGTAVHDFFAADRFELTPEARLDVARRVLTRRGFADAFDPAALLDASDALRTFVEARWPGARWLREVPVTAVVGAKGGERRIQGTIDLLLETECGVVLFDHKTFPGRAEQWAEQALSHALQLFTYAVALEAAGREVLGRWVHFPIGGGAVEVGQC